MRKRATFPPQVKPGFLFAPAPSAHIASLGINMRELHSRPHPQRVNSHSQGALFPGQSGHVLARALPVMTCGRLKLTPSHGKLL
eukprot:8425306-Alexandrium_andersonii.AAC.1